MEEYGGGDLLSKAMGSGARVVVVEDYVEAPAAFVLHLLLKRAVASGGDAALLALAQPFSHYDRVLRRWSKVMGQISDEVWSVIQSNETDIRGTVEAVYNRIMNPEQQQNTEPSSKKLKRNGKEELSFDGGS